MNKGDFPLPFSMEKVFAFLIFGIAGATRRKHQFFFEADKFWIRDLTIELPPIGRNPNASMSIGSDTTIYCQWLTRKKNMIRCMNLNGTFSWNP